MSFDFLEETFLGELCTASLPTEHSFHYVSFLSNN